MAAVPHSRSSAIVATGLSAATVALNVAGAAADAVPIAKQILNSAAHISAVAERIQKKKEAMYLLIEKADVYATQIDIVVAGRILDAPLQRRLERLYSVFLKIEALVTEKVGGRSNKFGQLWRNLILKPNRAEELVVELDREIQLFQLLTGIQLSLVADDTARAVEDTARAVAADARYDGQYRLLRDCDIEKLSMIDQRETDEGVVVWASARVKRQLMVVRYLDSPPIPGQTAMVASTSSAPSRQWPPFHEYLENIKKVSTVRGSHPHIVQLYGRHIQGPEVVFRSGTLPLDAHLTDMRATRGKGEDVAFKHMRLIYQILHASSHLADVHGLLWVGKSAVVDESGEPHIGLFDDIVSEAERATRASPNGWTSKSVIAEENGEPRIDISDDNDPFNFKFYIKLLTSFDCRLWAEEGVVEQIYCSALQTVITAQLRHGENTDRLQRLWGVIRQERLPVYRTCHRFPIPTGNLSLSEDMIASAQRYFRKYTWQEEDMTWHTFVRQVFEGGANMTQKLIMPSQIRIYLLRSDDGDTSDICVESCTFCGGDIRYDTFRISIPTGSLLAAEVARAVGLPDGLQTGSAGDILFKRVWNEDKKKQHYIPLNTQDPLPPSNVIGYPATHDMDGSDVYLALALHAGGYHPGKYLQGPNAVSFSYGGQEIRFTGGFALVPFNTDSMYWAQSYGGEPCCARPVEGARESNGAPLYHAIAEINGVRVPGKAGRHIGGGCFPFGGREHVVRHCEILCYR